MNRKVALGYIGLVVSSCIVRAVLGLLGFEQWPIAAIVAAHTLNVLYGYFGSKYIDRRWRKV